MTFQVKDRWNIPVTAVADEFIDQYMAAANGEYVKVYLYLLRHQSEPVSVDAIADALNHTESDVRRALAYWEKAGVLLREDLLSPDGSLSTIKRPFLFSFAAAPPFSGDGVLPSGGKGRTVIKTAWVGQTLLCPARRQGDYCGTSPSALYSNHANTPLF